MSESQQQPDGRPADDSAQGDSPQPVVGSPHADIELPDGVEISLSDLGRAYAKAVGLVSDEPLLDPADDTGVSDDAAVCPVSPRSIVEAILFVGSDDESQPLTTRKIAATMRDVSPGEVTKVVKELNAAYESQGAAFRIQQEKSVVRMVLTESCQPIRDRFYGEVRKARLGQQAIDVLAIVAYQQPVGKAQIDELRNRDCGSVLNQLTRRGLLDFERDPESPRSRIYRTTDRFLELFHLDSLDDLPQSAESLLPDADLE